MNLLILSTFNKDDDLEWNLWNVAHLVTHNRLFTATVKTGVNVLNFPIDVEEVRPDEIWKQTHYEMHQSLSFGLGLGYVPFNMADVSFDEEQQFKDWHLLHALVHKQLNTALGLT
jgi:hypothetical protein